MKGGVCQLLLWIALSTHLTTGIISLDQTQVDVDEDRGNIDLCLMSDNTLCLSVTSHEEDAEENKDYRAVNNVLLINSSQKMCVKIHIINDNTPEQDESFTVSFSDSISETECDGMDHGSGSSGDNVTSEGTNSIPLLPMVNENVHITIKDDDTVVVVASTVVLGFVGSLLSFAIIALLCWVVCGYCRKRKKKRIRGSNGVDSSYIEFNPILISIDRQNNVEHSTSMLNVHDAIVAVPLSEFAAYVKELHRDADKGFSQQYDALQAHSPKSLPCKAAELDDNINKNRYHNILPYDSSRVVLHNTGKKNSDYINASWINGHKREKTYVTCQGPLPETIADFWRMVWELEIPTIVMLTRTVEANKDKCEQYWPNKVEESMTLAGGLIILLQEVIPFADYEMRKLHISTGSEKRKVTHYLFQAWPDHGVPRYATALLGFIRHVRKCHFPSDPTPLAVHCSAGVGRTGTFIVLDIMLQVIEAESCINVYECILELRAQRCFMVQTEAQYVFIHDALEELITCGKTEISAGDLRIVVNRLSTVISDTDITGFQKQFQLLEQVTKQPMRRDLEISQKAFNVGKNRYPQTLPYNFHRVCLRVTGQPGSDYINASWINGYRQSNAFIVTQGPLQNTVNDLWRMVWEMNTRTIIMLCGLQENDEEVCIQYWPEQLKQQSYGNLTVKSKTELMLNDALCSRVFEVYRNGPTAAIIPEVVTVTQFHFHGWSGDGLTSDSSLLLDLLGRVLKNQISTGNKPIVVMCSDGSGRSGALVVLYSQLERLKTEHVVDVFQGIKAARTQRMGIVHNVESYKLIHELLLKYLTSFEESNYDNFEFSKK